MKSVLAVVTLSTLLAPLPQVPDPPPPAPSVWLYSTSWFAVPSGPLPWGIPQLPIVDLDVTPPDDEFDDITHTDGYAAMYADIEDRYDDIDTPIVSATSDIDAWLGGDELPDMTSGDFDTGLNPLGTGSMYASDFANDFGADIGTAFSYVRLLNEFDIGGSAYAMALIMVCIAWMMLITFVKFAIQLSDMLFNVVAQLIELIPFAE